MAIKIRLARGGSRKRPFYRIVAADGRMPRDGRYIERLGTYSPLLPKSSEDRVKMNMDRIQHWLGEGAQPTDRISRMLEAAGVLPAGKRANMKKGEPRKKAKERAEARAGKAEAGAEPAGKPEAEAPEAKAPEAKAETPTTEAESTETKPAEAAEAEAETPAKEADAPEAEAPAKEAKSAEKSKSAGKTKKTD